MTPYTNTRVRPRRDRRGNASDAAAERTGDDRRTVRNRIDDEGARRVHATDESGNP